MKLFGKRDFHVVRGKYGPRMSLFTSWSKEIERKIKRKGIVELELNYAKGWKRDKDLWFLKKVPNLLAVEIIDWNIQDVSAIHDLRSLRLLKVFTYCNTEIDFTFFPEIEDVSLEWRPKVRSLFACSGLKKLFINHYPGKSLEDFAKLCNLQYLSLKSPKIEGIGDVSELTELKLLELGNATRLSNLEGIEKLASLETLQIQTCSKIKNIEPIKSMTNLKRLFICDCGEIESLRPIAKLPELQEVHFYESTNILDGDLSPLKELPKFEDTSFQERKHYNLRGSDFAQRDPVALEELFR